VAFRLYAALSYAGSLPTVITLTYTWTRYSGTLTLPAGTTSAFCAIQTSSQQAATVYADGLQIEWGTVATPWEAPPNLASLGPSFSDNGKEPSPTAAGLVFYGQQAAVLPPLPFVTDGTPYTLIFAVTPAVANATQMIFSANSATGATGDGLFVRLKDDGTAEAVQYDGDRAAVSSSVPYQANVPQIICVRWDGASLQISNGAAAGTPAAVASMAPYSAALPTLGALCTDLTAQNYVGELHPTIVYPHAITDAQIAQMRSFFSGVMAQRGRPVGTLSQPYFPIVALGDSNTRSRLFDIRSAYPFILAGLAGHPVANAGIIGNTTAQMLARLPSLLAQFAPDTVTILGGTNDVNTGVASATVIANLGNIVTTVTGAGATAVLLTVPPCSTFSGTKNTVLAEVNAWIATQAAANVIVVDVHAALKDPAVPTQLLAIYDSGDHIHLNAAGQQLVADTMHAAMQGA
jgi:lysophospholipase L1-like esterase